MKLQALLSCLGLFLAASILSISVFSIIASPVSGADGTSSSTRTLYFTDEILPDHVLYPAMMAVDRVQLTIANPAEKILLQVEYADRRLASGLELLEKKNQSLAVTTLTKAEKYLQQAALAAQQPDVPERTRHIIKESIHFHANSLREVSPQLSDTDRSVIDKLLLENEAVLMTL